MYFTINNTTQDRNQRRFIFEDSPTKLTQREIEVYLESGYRAKELMNDPDLRISQDEMNKAIRSVQREAERLSRDDGYWDGKDMDNNVPIGKDAVQAERDKANPDRAPSREIIEEFRKHFG